MDTLYQSDNSTRIVMLMTPAETEGLIGFFERVSVELSWQPGDQLRAFQDNATHLAVMVDEEFVGGIQAVVGVEDDLPYRRVWPEVKIGEAPAAHVTIMALEKECRGPGLFWPLCVEL